MRRVVITSEDGSKTLALEEYQESYHSTHGALSESIHIFIKEGLQHHLALNPGEKSISILEAGLGTGLNSLLTAIELKRYPEVINLRYTSIEKYPVTQEEAALLDYPSLFPQNEEASTIYERIHNEKWGEEITLTEQMTLEKILGSFEEEFPKIMAESIDIIYYDAFSPETQPELWSEEIFSYLFKVLKKGGCLVTYSSKGIVKRALREVGFEVKRLSGPKGKKHIVRATKLL